MPAENPLPVTRNQATILAALLHEIRPRWSTEAIVSLIGKNLATIPSYPALAEAAIRVANDSTKQTPAIIFLDGKHWERPDQPREAPPPGPKCLDHPENEAHTCHCCKADILVGDRPPTHQGRHWTPKEPT